MTKITETRNGPGRKIMLLIFGSNIILMVIGVGLGRRFASLGTSPLQSTIIILLVCIIMWPVVGILSRILVKPALKDLSGSKEKRREERTTVAHELKGPLAAIKEGISIVLDGTGGPINEDQRAFLEIAERNVDRLTGLINDVLDLHKLESGKTSLEVDENDR